ncbi:LEC14B protein isoform X2 [Brachypodium distachyon]|uniref:LEC14B protein isoform X2 n=1 Tax=Brachypodium distachyon TaxID=15368 RepID=UPI0001C721C2|nr:LEC14B protein isoform X2 [Brachypodium distachyon]|eukprot:XP_014754959.1 LEC14B protein isoform X2 [Brachypodium distachyon]
MGYGMSRLEDEYSEHEGQSSDGLSSAQMNNEFSKLHNDIFHMTHLRSGPSESIRKSIGINKHAVSVTRLLRGREVNSSGTGKFFSVDRAFILGHYLPVDGPEIVDRMNSRAYVSQFSADGSLFVAGFQVYASLAPIIHIVNVGTASKESYANVTDIHDGLDFSQHEDVRYSFGLFSVKFSTDGRELVAGSNDDSIYVYDLQADKLTLRLPAHTSDVNTVAFADETGNLIYSGSDDNLCKVWDRRCLSTGEPAGVLTGHLHGITHIDSRGDGRCFISNGKDQAIKMWDIRKMTSNADGSENRVPAWDYTNSRYPQQYKQQKHPHDQSLATYRGHSVLRTLIRCYFSPTYSTGQKYIYTGSYDASICIYDVVSGSQVAKLHKGHELAVRDCSWHPFDPMLVSSSWDGRIAKWSRTCSEQDTCELD